MADTYTAHYTLTKPQIGVYDAAWGTKWATNLDAIDAALWAKVDAAGGTLTNPVINGFTGTGNGALTGTLTLTAKTSSLVTNSTGLTEFKVGNSTGAITGDGSGVGFYAGATRLGGIRLAVKGGIYKTTLGAWNGSAESEVLDIDTSGNVLVTVPGGLGYGTGAGGTVTQPTSKSTAVTLNKPCGQITMNGAALAAGASAFFTFNNSTIAATDSVLVSANSSAWGDVYDVKVWYTSAGLCGIAVANTSGSSRSDSVPINFAIIKGATS